MNRGVPCPRSVFPGGLLEVNLGTRYHLPKLAPDLVGPDLTLQASHHM